jgi:CHASE2 domain-containing sensor protein
VKEFWVYTLARLALFVVTWVAVTGIAALVTGEPYPVVTLLIAFLISGVGSYVVLRGPREALARKVEERAGRASARYEQMRSSEDVD